VLASAFANGIRTTTFAVMSTASAWAGIGLAQQIFNNKFIPVQRYRLIGFLAGLWAFTDQVSGSARFMYAVRLAIQAWYNTHVHTRRGGRPLIKNGDVYLFAVALGAMMAVFEAAPASVPGPRIRKVLNYIRTGRAVDPIQSSSK
jgi:hypothetical protein